MEKICNKCNSMLPLDKFSKAGNGNKYYKNTCKKCRNIKSLSERKSQNPKYYELEEEKEKFAKKNKKRCIYCNEVKDCKGFGPSPKNKDGLRGECYECHNINQSSRRWSGWLNFDKSQFTYKNYLFLLKKQQNKCLICKEELIDGGVVDHNHNSMLVRGVLCNRCNRSIGGLKDSKENLIRAFHYLNNSVKLLPTTSLSYDDVVLIAKKGIINSRREIPIEGFRIVISAMTSLQSKEFLEACIFFPNDLKPTIHTARDKYYKESLSLLKDYPHVFVGLGLNNLDIEDYALNLNYSTAFIDIASGYLPQIKGVVKRLKCKGFKKIICGSVHTIEGVNYLKECGVDIIRTGIGTSSQICSTKFQTGFHRGTFSEIYECSMGEMSILADGGYKYPGDYVKSFLAGSSYCMGARLFTKAKEARMHVEGNGEHFGMSNPERGVSNHGFDESFVIKIDNKDLKPLKVIIEDIWDGIRSGVSYSGYATLSDAIGNGCFEIKK